MSHIAGIDVSTRFIDIVWIDEIGDPCPGAYRYPLHGHDAWERTRSVRAALRGTSEQWDRTIAVGIEVAHGMSSGAVNRVVGAVLACLPQNILIQPWTAGAWKKAVGLPGNATKDQVVAFSLGRTQMLVSPALWPQDAHDAHLIAVATRRALEREVAAA